MDMMDNFKEDIVGRRSNVLPNILYALCWVMIVVFGLYALLMIQVLAMQFNVPNLVVALLAAACAALLFFTKDQLKLEY